MAQEMRRKGIRIAIGWSLASIVGVFVLLLPIEGAGMFFSIAVPIGLSLVSGGIAIRQWVAVFRKKYLDGIEVFCSLADDPLLMRSRIDNIWQNGTVITKRCHTDHEYLVFGDGKRSVVVPWKNITRLFCEETFSSNINGGPGSWRMDLGIILQDDTGEILRIFSQRWLFISSEGMFKNRREVMDKAKTSIYKHAAKYYPHVLLGADKELLAIFEQWVYENDLKEALEKHLRKIAETL